MKAQPTNLLHLLFAGLMALSWSISLWASPVCRYPLCFFGEEPIESRVFIKENLRLEMYKVGMLGETELVLLRYVNAKGEASLFIKGYLVAVKGATSGAVVFELFPQPGFPKVNLNGSLSKAESAAVTWTSESEEAVLKYNQLDTQKISRGVIGTQYRSQLANETLDQGLEHANLQLKETITRVNKACKSDLSFRQSIGKISPLKFARLDSASFPFRCAELLEPLAELCAEKKVAFIPGKKIVECRYTLNRKNSISVSLDGVLQIHTSLIAPRDGKNFLDNRVWIEKWLK